MDLEKYMRMVIDNLANKPLLQKLGYVADDKDCGYRAGLRYLTMARSADTDVIAQLVIYGEQQPARPNKEERQLNLFI